MWWHYFAALVALFCAGAHFVLGYKETIGWTREFVDTAAPSWVEGLDDDLANKHILWSKRLAFNIGAYNLMSRSASCGPSGAFIQRPALAAMLAIFLQFGCWWPQQRQFIRKSSLLPRSKVVSAWYCCLHRSLP